MISPNILGGLGAPIDNVEGNGRPKARHLPGSGVFPALAWAPRRRAGAPEPIKELQSCAEGGDLTFRD